MKLDSVIVFCCIALVLVGVILGINLDIEESSLKILNGFSTTLSAFATLFAAIVALYGLNMWRNQFVFSERFKAFCELEEIAIDGLSLVSSYKGVYWDQYCKFKTPTVYEDHEKERTTLSQSMRENVYSYSRKVDYAESLLTEKELKGFQFGFLKYEQNLYSLFQEIDRAYEVDGAEQRALLNQCQQSFIEFSKSIKKELRTIRNT
ncbi:hypothetical protein WMQ58_13705 [Vibrio diabolicus]|uniref:hypothetical protein n=1 Tax=Vibrio diabolicus TaxID=50719 RepID=UPI003753186C